MAENEMAQLEAEIQDAEAEIQKAEAVEKKLRNTVGIAGLVGLVGIVGTCATYWPAMEGNDFFGDLVFLVFLVLAIGSAVVVVWKRRKWDTAKSELAEKKVAKYQLLNKKRQLE